MDKLIEIEDLSFSYSQSREGEKQFAALKDISLEIERNSFVALIGYNGSGKSTLAKCLNALILPSEGNVYINGYDTKDEEHVWDIRQTVGMVFQNPDNQIVSSIVEDDIAFGPENLGIEPDEIRSRVDNALAAVGMDGYQRKAPHLLSGGQKQRIAIASAIAMRPECIVFDEPTAMLDPMGRREVMKIIKKLNEEGTTCILITHDMEEASQAERIIMLDEGSLKMDVKSEELFKDRKKLEELKIDLPPFVELGYALKDEGVDLHMDFTREEEVVEKICQLK